MLNTVTKERDKIIRANFALFDKSGIITKRGFGRCEVFCMEYISRKRGCSTREAILSFISAFWEEHNYAPTIREICGAVGISSPSTARYHLVRLKERGIITFSEKTSRSVRLIPSTSNPKTQFQSLVDDGVLSSPEKLAAFLSNVQSKEPKRTPSEWFEVLNGNYSSPK